MRIASPKNFWAGLMFVGFGLFAAVFAYLHYPIGSATRMGPGFFPTLLGCVLAILGLVILATSFTVEGPGLSKIDLRSLIGLHAACALFALALEPLGFVIALSLLIIIGAAAGHEFRLKEVIVLCAALVVFAVLVFVKGLTLQFHLWPNLDAVWSLFGGVARSGG